MSNSDSNSEAVKWFSLIEKFEILNLQKKRHELVTKIYNMSECSFHEIVKKFMLVLLLNQSAESMTTEHECSRYKHIQSTNVQGIQTGFSAIYLICFGDLLGNPKGILPGY